MGFKDHLATIEEDSKRRNRTIKRVIANSYQSSPPLLTSNLNQAGIVSRTTGEVRDTEFPVLRDIDDQFENPFTVVAVPNATITIDLSKPDAHYHRLKLDDQLGTITTFFINLENLAKNKSLLFLLDIS